MVSIAIDGPAGAGKSTLAKELAKELKYIYIDTGALYRAIALYAFQNNILSKDIEPFLPEILIELKYENDEQHIYLCGKDVSQEIRSPEVTIMSSEVAQYTCVRNKLLAVQQELAKCNNIIMDGRDIGTVILPNADAKFFITATAEARAKRRYEEYLAKGENVRYNDILEDMNERDYMDYNRDIAPLRRAEDAKLIDSSNLTVKQALELVILTLKERKIQ